MGLMIFTVLVLAGECCLVYMFIQFAKEGRRDGVTRQVPFFNWDAPSQSGPRQVMTSKVTLITAFRNVGGKTRTNRRPSETSQEDYPCSL